ncbi:MAG: hypothetical protein IT374_21385 [Polyangiaceae bacterium]|nr:hypothetical protein [Polyangiaceae bacterium]
MPKYSAPTHPELAALVFSRTPGNYIVHFADGSAYAGRQARSTNRIRAAQNRWDDAVAVQFMTDHSDDECVRADREDATIEGLLNDGVSLRNSINAATPRSCRPRRSR